MSDTSITDHSIIKQIRGSQAITPKGANHPKARSGIYGHTLDSAIKLLADKLKAPFRAVRARVVRLIDNKTIAYAGDRLVVIVKEKMANVTHKMLRQPLIVPANPADDATHADHGLDTIEPWIYESCNAAYEAMLVAPEIEARFSTLKPQTWKAYEDELMAELTAA